MWNEVSPGIGGGVETLIQRFVVVVVVFLWVFFWGGCLFFLSFQRRHTPVWLAGVSNVLLEINLSVTETVSAEE